MELETTVDLHEAATLPNITHLLSDHDLDQIGNQCKLDTDRDLQSRSEWESRNAEAIKLALQVKKAKNFPWPGSSNVKFPLITIAALQYHARAYPALISSTTPVECRVIGPDQTGQETEQARRISTHMSWQLLEEDESWEENHDKLLIIQPILGTVFKKSYFCTVRKHNVSDLVLPDNLIVNYWTQTLDSSTRVTQRLVGVTDNTIYERRMQGLYRDVDLVKQTPNETQATQVSDERQGIQRPQLDDSTPYSLMEQHCLLDLDADGYKEPYTVVYDHNTGAVLRIVARFDSGDIQYSGDRVAKINGHCYYTKYGFIPSPDGGFYDLGFGALLGPINDSVNSALNQLFDAGTMSITGGGFLGRGAKVRGGDYSFRPWEWKRVDSTGDDLSKNIVPLQVREPSRVLFDLLTLLINYGERIAGAVDILGGVSPGQNTPAETTRTVAQEGLKIFNGIYKRTWRSMKEEFNKLYKLNQVFLEDDNHYEDLTTGANAIISRTDYMANTVTVRPAANQFVSSENERLKQAVALREWAMTTPGADIYEANKRYLEALHIPGIVALYPDTPQAKTLQNPKMVVEQMKMQLETAKLQLQHKTAMLDFALKAQKNEAQVRQLLAMADQLDTKGALNLAQAGGVQDGHDIARFEAALGAARDVHKGLIDMLKTMNEVSNGNTGGMAGMETPASDQGVSQPPGAKAAGDQGKLGQ